MTVRSSTSTGIPIAPSSVIIPTGGTFDLYNTEDQTTNYERLRADWSGNIAQLSTQNNGTGLPRAFRIGGSNGTTLSTYIQFQVSSFPVISLVGFNSAGTSGNMMLINPGTTSASSGTPTCLAVVPTINQSGTAGYTALDVNPTETATGSGTKLLQRWAVGGSALAQINNSGTLSTQNLIAVGAMGLGTALGSADATLNRDAADTLALRRGTNAQTFRVYNTYTDASNYERGFTQWNSNVFEVGTVHAGTGTARQLRLMTSAGQLVSFAPGGTDKWQMVSGGHFFAVTDNTYDIGASGANRPRNVYIGGSTVIGAFHTVGVSTVAALPAAAGAARAQIFVSDSSVAAAGNFGAIVVGGGANIVPVFCDGTNWRIG